ncbi:CD63 antigen [Ooceraea biroi]|uniref:CD63 antigen n=1 Tax=Ooceraea biroi TaxID=2015173 RepID=A0A026WS18_OOCBI|nr:CD63 antigen [Ooceraea biroi]
MIIVGVIVFLVSFFGCCGAVKENHCMIITYTCTNMSTLNSMIILMFYLQCCGMNGPADWPMVGFPSNTVPDSCCKELPTQSKCDLNSIHIYGEGCMTKLQSAIENNAMILGGVGIGIALIQLIGVIFACCLARSIRREYETV